MKKTKRTTQLGDLIRNDLSQILQRELSDPDLGFITVTDVELATDLRFARIHVSTIGDEAAKQKMMAALDRNRSKIRYMLGQRAKMRHTPELDFRYDSTIERASGIEKILREVLPKESKEDDDTENE
jgi:ribosome-binding factor A